MGCGEPEEAFTVTTAVTLDHSHEVTIWQKDLDSPPSARTITTSEAGTPPHTHTIYLVRTHFTTLAKGQELEIRINWVTESNPNFTGIDHNHNVILVKP